MELCVDVSDYNSRTLVTIKQPRSTRHPNGDAITKIQMTLDEAHELYRQLHERFAAWKRVLEIQPDTQLGYFTEPTSDSLDRR